MGVCGLRALLAALVLSAISLASCVDVPVPAACSNPVFSEVDTTVHLNVNCNGQQSFVESEVVSNTSKITWVYVEAICTWNQNESAQEMIRWRQLNPMDVETIKVTVTSEANCTFAGCYYDSNGNYYLLESKSCVYDRDECALGEDDCHENATCVNTIDGYECHCLPTFTGNGRNCTENPLPTSTPNVLLTSTPSVLPTTTPNVLPTSTPSVTPSVLPTTTGLPMEGTPFPDHYLSLLVLVLLLVIVSAAVFALTVWLHSRRKYNRISFPGKVDPDCTLVNPKSMVHHLSLTSLSSELHELSFRTNDSYECPDKQSKYPISKSMLEIQQLSFHLQPTSSSSDEGDSSIHCSSLPNIQDGFKTTAAPKDDTLELPGSQADPELQFTGEDGPEQSSSALLADSAVEWCLEDRVSNASDSNSLYSAAEHDTSLGYTHQSDSHTQPLARDPAHSPTDCQSTVAVMDRVSLIDSMTEVSLADSLTHEQLDDKLDEGEVEEGKQQDEFPTEISQSSSIFPKHDGGLVLEEGGYIESQDKDYFFTVTYSDSSCDQREYVSVDPQRVAAPFSDIRQQQYQGVTFMRTFPPRPMAGHERGLEEEEDYGNLEIDLTHSLQHQMATY